MKIILSVLMLVSFATAHAEDTASYECRPAKSSQCISTDKDCWSWGMVTIDSIVLDTSFSAKFYSEGDDECENCEGADYTFSSGNQFVSDKKQFNLMSALTPKISFVTKANGTVSGVILTTEEKSGSYTMFYNCKLEN
jgi:hypothetical protein